MTKLTKILKDKVLGAQIAIYSNGKNFNYNYGMRSLNENEVVNDETIFRIASISKTVVAMAALKLMEENELDINDDISNIFGFKIRNPKFPNSIITTKMLMLHTSSILDGYDDEDLSHNGIEKGYNGVNGKKYYVSLEDLLLNKNSKYYSDKTFGNYKPGTKFNYSNFGTGILACIVEVVSGRLFTEYVETEIFKPLNIDASFIAKNLNKNNNISDTFYYDEKEQVFKTNKTSDYFLNASYPPHPLGTNFRGPAGGLYISMKDLSKIMKTLMHDGAYKGIRILKKETVDLMLQMHYLGDNKTYLAKGLQLKFIDYIDNVMLKGHTGNAYGVRSFMFFSKEHDFGVCFILNGGRYQMYKPDLIDIFYDVLKYTQDLFLKPKKRIVTINNNEVSLNNRKIVLNNYKITNNVLCLSLIDLANILDVIPKIEKNAYEIKGVKFDINDNLINLEQTLKKLKISYTKNNNNYIINLNS